MMSLLMLLSPMWLMINLLVLLMVFLNVMRLCKMLITRMVKIAELVLNMEISLPLSLCFKHAD